MLTVTEEIKRRVMAIVGKPCLWIKGEVPNNVCDIFIFKGWKSEQRMVRMKLFDKKTLKTVITEFGVEAAHHVNTDIIGIFKADDYILWRLEKGVADYEAMSHKQKLLQLIKS